MSLGVVCAGLAYDAEFRGEVDEIAQLGDAFVEEDVEFAGFKRRRNFIFDNLGTYANANLFLPIFT